MEEQVQDMNGTIKELWKYLKKEKKNLIIIVIFVVISTLASVISPFILGKVIDNAIPFKNMKVLFLLLFMLAITYLLKSLLTFITNRRMAYVSEQTLYLLRKDLFNHLEDLPMSYFDTHEKGDLMSRFTNDIAVISDVLTDAIVEIISSFITLIGVTIMMFYLSIPLSVTVIITVPIFFILVFKIGKKANDFFTSERDNLGEVSSFAEEYFSGMKVIKSLQQEDFVKEEFHQKNQKLCDSSILAQTYSSFILPINAMITNLGNILLIGVGAYLVLKGQTTVGSILAFLNYASMFRSPITNLASLFASMQSALAGAERVFKILRLDSEFNQNEGNILDNIRGEICFENVSFEYVPNRLVLKKLNFKINPGETLAIVGPTGSGKTTLINLLNRFYEITDGSIKIDGNDIREISKPELRKKIGLVLQDTYLFKETVENNIRYSKLGATFEEVKSASIEAMAHPFIHRLPKGYQAEVEEEGSNFSQGERQLISIARTILADPEILVLDEATSNIDTRTEILVQQGMVELMKDRTCLIIAHRLSTIKSADRILVLKDGEIIEEGNHQQLLEKEGFYYELYNSQFEN